PRGGSNDRRLAGAFAVADRRWKRHAPTRGTCRKQSVFAAPRATEIVPQIEVWHGRHLWIVGHGTPPQEDSIGKILGKGAYILVLKRDADSLDGERCLWRSDRVCLPASGFASALVIG